jgi:hypothetical protein
MRRDNEYENERMNNHRSPLLLRLLSVFVRYFFLSFIRTAVFVFYLSFFLVGFVSDPRLIDFVAGPLSLVGLWILLYNFDLVVTAAKR